MVSSSSGDASVIDKALAESVPEPTTIDLANEDEEDDTDDYIDDGYIAPVNSTVDGVEDVFFV